LYPAALALIFCSLTHAAAPGFPVRKELTVGKYQIAYSEGDETLAQGIAAGVDRIFQIDPQDVPPEIELPLTELKQHRDGYLTAMCHYLHLAKPTPRMSKVYDSFIDLTERQETLVRNLQATTTKFQLWRGPELKARLEAGETIPGITMRADGSGIDSASPQDAKDLSNWLIPIMVSSRDTETGPALTDKMIGYAHAYWKILVQLRPGRVSIHTIFHETVENALIENYLPSQDRRWFCEGVANYVGYKIIEDKFGPVIARQYYDIDSQIAMYADLRPRIRLEQWTSLEAQQKLNHDDRKTRQGMANYAFATEVIFKVAAKHGADFLPRLLAEAGKTPAKKTSIKTIYRAFQKLYGEDLRSYLPGPH